MAASRAGTSRSRRVVRDETVVTAGSFVSDDRHTAVFVGSLDTVNRADDASTQKRSRLVRA
jgi:hypothetical protein